ncbi:hypothetical protein [Corallococcus llansteffanensis]|uniref:Uncharacterized protein n=1 Tax=Corallococcus llansteffanensis TaxID=2316731 RepID=A0A3A8QI58_9BACT|nr:hypothetical protein [Corallococcus llansteffanensis]RKH68267.1 hypothetical protein D7V93_01495 [Corallococcus llansteffanensis]
MGEAMLAAVEAFYRDALQTLLPRLQVTLGPGPAPDAELARRVDLFAEGLSLTPPEGTKPGALREPAWFTQELQFSADGQTQEFLLPEQARGEVAEVESPPGRPVPPGDAYTLEGRSLRFHRAPEEAKTAVWVLLRGERARGYTERCPCEIHLVTSAWARAPADADGLLTSVLAGVLNASTRMGTLNGATSPGLGVRLRLQGAVTALRNISRGHERVGELDWFFARARFLLHGELEQAVVVGQPEPVGLIVQTQNTLQVNKP